MFLSGLGVKDRRVRPDRQLEAVWGEWPLEVSWAYPRYQHGLEEQGAAIHWIQGPCGTSPLLIPGIQWSRGSASRKTAVRPTFMTLTPLLQGCPSFVKPFGNRSGTELSTPQMMDFLISPFAQTPCPLGQASFLLSHSNGERKD